jgi:putative flippase GtrA
MADLDIGKVRHVGGFLLAGFSAFATDAGLVHLLTKHTALGPLTARPAAIAAAMLVSWLINRTITFAETKPPSWAEFGKFAAASFAGQATNFLVYAAILTARPATSPTLAIAAASGVAMGVAYVAFRYGVFRRS